jgi:hypothetical protein
MLWRNLERPTLVQVKKPNSQTKETNGTKQSAGDAENRDSVRRNYLVQNISRRDFIIGELKLYEQLLINM